MVKSFLPYNKTVNSANFTFKEPLTLYWSYLKIDVISLKAVTNFTGTAEDQFPSSCSNIITSTREITSWHRSPHLCLPLTPSNRYPAATVWFVKMRWDGNIMVANSEIVTFLDIIYKNSRNQSTQSTAILPWPLFEIQCLLPLNSRFIALNQAWQKNKNQNNLFRNPQVNWRCSQPTSK